MVRLALLLALPSFSQVQVIAHSQSDDGIIVTFNKPMVPLGEPGEMGKHCPIEVRPAIEGRCRWRGTQVLAYEPVRPLPKAMEFTVTVPGDARSLVSGETLGETQRWTFETLRPQLVDSRPRHGDKWIDLKPVILLHFNQPMDPRRARDGLELNGVALGVRRATPEEIKSAWPWYYGPHAPSTHTVLALKPARLERDKEYTLRLKQGLRAAEGDLGLQAERAVQFETWQTFRLAREPEAGCLPRYHTIGFSNPVDPEELSRHLRVDPSTSLPPLERGWADAQQRVFFIGLPGIEYQPDTVYRFTVDGGLKDTFGNALGQDASFTLATGGYCPNLTMPLGFGVLESYLPPRHPVSAVNVQRRPLEKRLIPPEEIVPFMVGGMQRMGTYVSKDWDLTDKRNARLNTFIGLNDVLGPERGGFVHLLLENIRDPHWLSALDNVTRTGLTFKDSIDGGLIWTTDLKTGKAMGGVPVELRDDKNSVVWSGRTDGQGFTRTPGWLELGLTWRRWNRPRLWALARHKDGPALLSSGFSSGMEPWRFNVNYEWSPSSRTYQGTLFSDRGVYRPGETVRLKGVLRRLKGGDWTSLGEGDPRRLIVTVMDPRGAKALVSTAALSDLSSFDFDLPLRESAPTGWWQVRVSSSVDEEGDVVQEVEEGEDYGASALLSHGFRVEAFKPASFEVKAFPGKSWYVAGDTYTASVEGWYLFGAPMTKAPADWKLRLEPGSYSPPGREGFDFYGPGYETGRALGGGQAELDEQGRLSVSAPIGAPGRVTVAVLEAGVQSPERQRLFGRATTIVHAADAYVGLRPPRSFVDKGKEARIDAVAVRPDGTWAEGLPAELTLVRRDWPSVRRAGVAGRLEWVSQQRDTVIATTTWTTARSTFTWEPVVAEPGYYLARAVVRDEKGREHRSESSFYVIGAGEAWWARSDHDIVELVPDKESYKPGETARILVKSPFPKSRALVTLERETVIEKRVLELDGGAKTIDIKLPESAVPNVYVGVMLVTGRAAKPSYAEDGDDLAKPQAKFGYASLSVDPGGRRLPLKVRSERDSYRPGDTVNVELEAEPGAEATLFAVDEGVLALTAYDTPDIFSAFYGARALRVATADSRPHVIGQRSYGEKGKNRGGGGGEDAKLEGVDLRSRFVPTAFWSPTVRAGADGRARASFKLPDNLSRFRLMAVAHNGKRFGSADSRLTVSKPLMLRPSFPRIARLGDKFQGGAVVHNYTADGATVTVALEGFPQREVFVRAGGAVETVWPLEAGSPGAMLFRLRARSGAESDGLEWPVRVVSRERMETNAATGVVETSITEALMPVSSGSLALSWASTALAGLQEGARYLLEYPYGCLEQRLSRALPVVTGAELVKEFGLGNVEGLKASVQQTLEKLPDFQHPSGGYYYWPDPWRPDPYITAYALEVAALAKKEGYAVPEASLERAVQFLLRALPVKEGWAFPYSESEEYAWRAYAVYALSLYGRQTPAFEQLYARRDQLPYEAKAHLLKAARRPDQRDALYSELLGGARLSPRSLHFEEPSESRWTHQTSVKTTALVLQAMLEARGGFPGDEKAVAWLVGERKAKGRWRTTQENAASLRALQDFYRRYEKEEPDFAAKAGGVTERFKGRSLKVSTHKLPLSEKLELAKEGIGRLYYTLALTYAPSGYESPKFEGLQLERAITPTSGGELKAGGRAVVTLTVRTTQDRAFVAVEDPLPAGFEIVDPTFAVESAEGAATGTDGRYWGTFSRSEKYDDRIVVFADYLGAGEHKYSYLVQATTPGEYHAPAAWVEAMYEPEVFGRTASGRVEVKR